jgi:hypothetical protein
VDKADRGTVAPEYSEVGKPHTPAADKHFDLAREYPPRPRRPAAAAAAAQPSGSSTSRKRTQCRYKSQAQQQTEQQ